MKSSPEQERTKTPSLQNYPPVLPSQVNQPIEKKKKGESSTKVHYYHYGGHHQGPPAHSGYPMPYGYPPQHQPYYSATPP